MNAPLQELSLAERVAAEGRRLEAMGRPRASARRVVLAVAVAALVHVGLFAVPVPRVSGPAPPLPPRPAGVSVVRWMPEPAPREAAPPVPETPSGPPPESVPPPVAPRGTLPRWVAEPVEEPPPATRLDVLPAEASILPVPPPRSQEEPSARVEAVRPLPIPESKVEPIFPPVARSLRARGTVVLEVLVGVDGKVRRTRVLDCTRPGVGFEAAAARAVAQWEFRPGRVGDQPVEASTVVRVEFR